MIEGNYFWTVVLTLAIGSFLIRFSIIAISSRIQISDNIKKMFSYIPAAVLPGFVVPLVVFHQGRVDWAFGKERVLALVVAILVSVYFRSTIATIVSGLIVLYIITQVLN